MRLSVERYFLINAGMDGLLLMLALRLCGVRATLRLVPAAAAGALYATLCALPGAEWASSLPVQGGIMLLMLLIANGRVARGMGRMIASMAMGTLVVGGATEWLTGRIPGAGGFLAAALAGCLLICLWQDRRQLRLTRLTIRVYVGQPGGSACFDALIDTGNRLREPVSGLPVLIAEERLLAEVLPERRRLRRIPFGGLGGCGFLEAFRPDTLRFQMDGRWQDAPAVWLAVYRGCMSGRIHALAPPVFALGGPDRADTDGLKHTGGE